MRKTLLFTAFVDCIPAFIGDFFKFIFCNSMKKLFFLSLFSISTTICFSQIKKGQWLLGGEISFSSSKSSNNVTSYTYTTLDLSPSIGYFVLDRLPVGLKLNYSKNKPLYINSGNPNYSAYSLSPFARYYFLQKEKRINVLLDAAYVFSKAKSQDITINKSNGYMVKAGPVMFLSTKVAVEFLIGLNHYKVKDMYYKTDEFNSAIGLKIHLGE